MNSGSKSRIRVPLLGFGSSSGYNLQVFIEYEITIGFCYNESFECRVSGWVRVSVIPLFPGISVGHWSSG